MKNIYLKLGLLLLWLFGSSFPLVSQTELDCAPKDTASIQGGELFLTYGNVNDAFTTTNRSTITMGQPFVGEMPIGDTIGGFGYWARFVLPPQSPTVLASEGDFPSQVLLSWVTDPLSPVASLGFRIFRDGDFLVHVDDAKARQFIDFNVQAGELYEYTVRGLNEFGTGSGGVSVGFVNPNGLVTGKVISPTGNPIEGAVISLSPTSGKSLLFDGIANSACVSYQDVLSTDLFTVVSWVKIGDTHNSDGIVDFGSNTNNNWWLHTTANGADKGVVFGIGNGTSGTATTHEFESTTADDWHHIAATFDGTKLQLYVDGILMDMASATMDTTKTLLKFGQKADGTGFFDGQLDDVRLYNRVLTQTELIENKNITASSKTPNLVAYWKMDEGIGKKVFDLGANKATGVLFGATFSEDTPQILTAGKTDETGFYAIEGIDYSKQQSFVATASKNFFNNQSIEFNAARSSYGTLTDIDLQDAATIEIVFEPFDLQSRQTILSKNNGMADVFELIIEGGQLKMNMGSTSHNIGTLTRDYHHFSVTLDQTGSSVATRFYLDGVDLGTMNFSGVAENWLGHPWMIAASGGNSPSNFFTGLIDDVALYNGIRAEPAIQLAERKGTTITDTLLLSWFGLNEGEGDRFSDAGLSALPDTGQVFNTTWSILTKLPSIQPHEFQPNSRIVNVNASNTAIGNIDFKDLSTINVTGKVRYENTFCFQEEVEILVNGNSHSPPIMTDKRGFFSADFEPGRDIVLTPFFQKIVESDSINSQGDTLVKMDTVVHKFSPFRHDIDNISRPVAGVVFFNQTKRELSGNVLGGHCRMPVIDPTFSERVIVELRSDDGCYVRRDTITEGDGKYKFSSIPPITYSIGVAVGSKPVLFDYFNTLGGSPVDLVTKAKDTIDFIYYSFPEVEISAFPQTNCSTESFNILNTLAFQSHIIKVFQPYLNQKCYLDTADLELINNIASNPAKVKLKMTEGEMGIKYQVGVPNFVSPYTKTLSVKAIANDIEGTTTINAVILGEKDLENTVSVKNPPVYPFFILRDPPGDGSYAFLEKNQQVCREVKLTATRTVDAGVSGFIGGNIGSPKVGVKAPGVDGVSKGSNFMAGGKISASYDYSFNEEKGGQSKLCLTINERIETSSEPEFIGADADIFFGAALNVIGGDSDSLKFNLANCAFEIVTIPKIALDPFTTDFVFTAHQIKNVVIPQAEADGDTITANRWKNLLTFNEKLKAKASMSILTAKVNQGNIPSLDNKDLNNDNPDFIWKKKKELENGDEDGDGIKNVDDNCPYTANPMQEDSNNDGVGSACALDYDSDGIEDLVDNCPYIPNPKQEDSDNDGIGDACESDRDNDGIIDDEDDCPNVVGEDCDLDNELGEELTLSSFRSNLTFDAGVVYESSWQQDTVESLTTLEGDDEGLGLTASIGFGSEGDHNVFGGLEAKVNFSWGNTEYESNEKSNSTTVGFVLQDDDPNDQYTVDILTDTYYKTPVFRVKGGNSSCPWEPHLNENEEPQTRSRHYLELKIDKNVANNVGENEEAIFRVTLANLSETNEPRAYIIAPVVESNLDGAIITIGQQQIPQSVAIQPGPENALELIMTVKKGPVNFQYQDLKIEAYSECDVLRRQDAIDGKIERRHYQTVAFDVNFIPGCSDVAIETPTPGWVITPASDKRLEIQVDEYDLNQSQLDQIRLQYRLVGGSGIWINFDTIQRADLGPASASGLWQIGDLADGEYDIRAVTDCCVSTNCDQEFPSGTSEPVRGMIEQRAPQLLGVPEPADGVLSAGDEISISFDENIACELIQMDDRLSKNNIGVYDIATDQLVNYTMTCLDNKIVIVLTDANRLLENRKYRVETRGIQDLVGNVGTDKIWEFLVDRNSLLWEGLPIDEIKNLNEELTVTRIFANRGGNAINFQLDTINRIPSWMHVVPRSGTIEPGQLLEVRFTFPADLTMGDYKHTVLLYGSEGQEELPVNVKVRCPQPDWNFTRVNEFQNSMNFAIQLKVDRATSADRSDVIGAFIGDELRGVANIEYVRALDTNDPKDPFNAPNAYVAFLTVYSNGEDEPIQFRVWDGSQCITYNDVVENFDFVPGTFIGTPLTPIEFNTSSTQERMIPLKKGWNWVSYNLDLEDNGLDSLTVSLKHKQNQDQIQSVSSFSSYDATSQKWIGGLNEVSFRHRYLHFTQAVDTLVLIGTPYDVPSSTIQIKEGWNWIGFVPQIGMGIDTALSSLTFVNGDLIKSHTAFAQYIAGEGWIGSLDFMEPGEGYLLNKKTSGTLTYPNIGDRVFLRPATPRTVSNMIWEVEPADYEQTMTLIATLDGHSSIDISEEDEIGVFVGEEVRGAAKIQYIPETDTYLAFLTVFANQGGEALSFVYYDNLDGHTYNLTETLAFRGNDMIGSVRDPFVFSVLSTAQIEMPTLESFKVYPNPAQSEVFLSFDLLKSSEIKVEIVDVLGHSFESMEVAVPGGASTLKWDASNIARGVYFIKIYENEQLLASKKLLIVR